MSLDLLRCHECEVFSRNIHVQQRAATTWLVCSKFGHPRRLTAGLLAADVDKQNLNEMREKEGFLSFFCYNTFFPSGRGSIGHHGKL